MLPSCAARRRVRGGDSIAAFVYAEPPPPLPSPPPLPALPLLPAARLPRRLAGGGGVSGVGLALLFALFFRSASEHTGGSCEAVPPPPPPRESGAAPLLSFLPL